MSRSTILFVAEAVTLAHVVRLVTLATGLQARGHDVVLATDPRYAGIVGPLPFPVFTLQSMPAARFQRAIASGAPIFDAPTLDRYIDDDLAMFKRVRPQVVVGDFRLSLSVSARITALPFVNLTNAYWSPLANIRRLVPEFDWVRRLRPPLAQVAFDAFQRVGYFQHAQPINRLRRRHGLPSLGLDFRSALMDGDVICFADWPAVVPLKALATGQHYIGPVPWSPSVPVPPWWDKVCRRETSLPLVYVNLGSSGPPGALQSVLDGLATLPVRVVAATAGRAYGLVAPANAHVADILPGDRACDAADLVVCNGGSPATCQALAKGKPVVGVATNMDQFLNMAAVEDAGLGRLVRSGSASSALVRRVVADAVGDRALADRSQRFAASVHGIDAVDNFCKLALAATPGAPPTILARSSVRNA